MTTVTTSYWAANTSAQVKPTTVGGVLRTAAAAEPAMLVMVGGRARSASRAVCAGVMCRRRDSGQRYRRQRR